MSIRSVEVFIVDLPTLRPHQLAMHTITTQAIVYAKVTDEEGRSGWGEVATIGGASYGESTVEAIKANIDAYITPHIIGKNPLQFNAIMHEVGKYVRGNYFAKSVIECALIDLAGHISGMAAYDFLGGKIHDSLPLAWTLASGDTGKDIEEAKQYLAEKRHKIFKLKIGKGDPDKNVAHVLEIIKAVGDQARITVDVNQAWDESTAVKQIAKLEAGGVSMIEQPLPAWNMEGMARLTERFDATILADEAATSIETTFQIAKHRYGNAIALKPCKTGGIMAAKKQASIAEAAGLGLYGGTMIESSVGTALCAQLYSTIPHLEFGTEIFGPLLFSDDVVTEGLKFENYEIVVPDGPGFGVTVDEEKIKHYSRSLLV